MNVTVILPASLRPAVEGRKLLELGVPASADLGDLLQTLFTLYPKLRLHVPSEKRPVRQHLNIVLSGAPGRDGQKLYLFASAIAPPPLVGRKAG